MPQSQQPYEIASLLRRFAALVYDLFLNFALWMVISAVYVKVFYEITGVAPEESGLLQWTLFPLLLLGSLLFYGWFWTHGGRTLGMQAWRLRTVTDEGQPLNWLQALQRAGYAFLTNALFGVGLLWCLIDNGGNTLYDWLSHTRVVLEPKQKKR